MNTRDRQLRELAEQAVRDIVEIDAQVAAGEIPADRARALRGRYRSVAGRALAALDSDVEVDPDDTRASTRSGRPRAWTMLYGLAGVTVLIVAVVLLPTSVLSRPTGGFVTGNEAVQGAGGAPALDPSATVTDTQLEQVVAANPDVVGMRLALADRYQAQGEYGPAMRHYLAAQRREPDNAEVLAHLGWLLHQIGQVGPAWESVNRALTIDPSLQDALWFRANIALYGRNDPTTALGTLTELQRRPLTADVREQVDRLLATARQRQGGAR